MQKKAYTFTEDLTSDVMFSATGPTIHDMFEAAAEAMFSVVCDIKQIKPVRSIHVKVYSVDEKGLLFNFLNALLTNSDIEGLFLCRFTVNTIIEKNGFILKATASGEKKSPEKGGTVVKGITYYGYKFEKNAEGYQAQVALDI